MRIGIDMRPLVWPGIGRYTFELARNLARLDTKNEYFLYYRSQAQFDEHRVEGANIRTEFVPFNIYSPFEHPWFLQAMLRAKLDVFHSPSSLNVPALCPCKLVVSLHDIMFKERPELVPSKLAAAYFNSMNWWALRSASKLLCISEFTRERLSARYPQHAAKALVAYNGVSEEIRPVTDPALLQRMKAEFGIRNRYVLYVGTYKRHKNLLTLVRAYAGLPRPIRDECQLVFVRKQFADRPEVGELMDELGVTPHFVPIDYVPNELLAAVYSGASVAVFPSTYEGFGLPLVEAMTCGAPVVASDIPPFRETTGDRIRRVDPHNVEEMRDAMLRLLTDSAFAAEMRRTGQEQASKFTWTNTARKALEVYESFGKGG